MTRKQIAFSVVLVAIIAVSPAAYGQIVGEGATSNNQASWNTAGKEMAALRTPGSVVAGARARYAERQSRVLKLHPTSPTITQPAEEEPNLGEQISVLLHDTVYQLIQAFFSRIFTLLSGAWTDSFNLDLLTPTTATTVGNNLPG